MISDRKFALFHIPVFSFFSKHLYQEVGQLWPGTCLGYLFLLVAITLIPLMMQLQVVLNQFVREEAPPVIEQVPPFTITKGNVVLEAKQPYFIRDPETEEIIAAIDTTGTITSLSDTQAPLLLTRTKLIMRNTDLETRTIDLSTIENFVVTPQRIERWLQAFRGWFVIFLYPAMLALTYGIRIIQMLIYALIGMLFASLINVTVPYRALVRLSVVATSPAIILNTLLMLTGTQLPFPKLLYFLISMGYLFFGLKAMGQSLEPKVTNVP